MVEPIPPDSQPSQFLGITVSALCSLFPRPLILTGLFRDLLTRHFAAPELIEEPDLRHLIWRPDEHTAILVEPNTSWTPELTEFRPGVIIKRNAVRNQRLGIGDRQQTPPTDRFGHDHYATFWIGSHTLFCVAGSGAQAELLATEVYRELHQNHPVISGMARLHKFHVLELGEVAEVEESTENYVVPVTVAYAFEDRWVLRQERPLLRSLRLSSIIGC